MRRIRQLSFTFLVLLVSTHSYASEPRRDWERLQASYEVPVPTELKQFGFFPNVIVKRRLHGQVIEIKYTLPAKLLGKPLELTVRSTDPSGSHFQGDLSEMTCTSLQCNCRYPRLKVSAADVRSAFLQNGITGEELENRMKVFSFFQSGDPGGVIHYAY